MKYLLIDFYALFHRSRSALLRSNPGGFSSGAGIPTTGVFSTLSAILAAMKKHPNHSVVVCADLRGRSQRQAIDSDYKANRQGGDNNFVIEAKETLNLLRYLFPIVSKEGFEADDVISSLIDSGEEGDSFLVISCDKDLLQHVSPSVTVELFSSAKRWKTYTVSTVKEEFGLSHPWHITLMKALSGDGSDNIVGLHRVGDKTAAKEIAEATGPDGVTVDLHSLDTFAEGREEGGAEKFRKNLSLVLPLDAEVVLPCEYAPKLDKFFERLEFLGIKSILKREEEIRGYICSR